MAKRGRRKTKRVLRRRTIGHLARRTQLALLIVAAAVVGLTIFAVWRKEPPQASTATATLAPTASSTPLPPTRSPSPEPSITPARPTFTPILTGKRLGILAGHSGPENDPGAVCPDGLREVDINLAVAKRVLAVLQLRGYEVDLLEEYDDRLNGYQAAAFLSIHSDACDIPEASGFKVARVSFSAIPEIEDALVECLYREYGRATGLPRHDYSITPAMHGYHAFLKIDPQTPGAIIEMGFMAADRNILVNHPDTLAAGIVAGLLCFLEP